MEIVSLSHDRCLDTYSYVRLLTNAFSYVRSESHYASKTGPTNDEDLYSNGDGVACIYFSTD